ncbi:MAG TPA: FAD-binding oxidoreductase [Solirubrobacteraceae bacterium]|nr:FAD-binding oxidoreductase [Solirubrobacteraceae bacterium]
MLVPESFDAAAAELADATAAGEPLRIRGGGTKSDWGVPASTAQELSTARLDALLEHNEGDLTATVQAGLPMARLAERLAETGQMLALDPPLQHGSSQATIGGVIATADSGPLSHRYGRPRDLVLGITFALSDGTIARAGGRVIKNVAGYDLGKLFCGSFGTLGLVLSLTLRLHPLPAARATAIGIADDPDRLAAAAQALAGAPLELEALDVAWRGGRGGLLACCGGAEALRRAKRTAQLMQAAGLDGVDVTADDTELWARQRAGQRSADRALVRVAAQRSALPAILRACDRAGGTLVGRAAEGVWWAELDPTAVMRLRVDVAADVPGSVSVVLDAAPEQRAEAWGAVRDQGAAALMRQIKARFDPAGTCNPGIFVGGI